MRKKILVIDDQDMFRQQFINAVKSLNLDEKFEIIEAVNGIDACDKIQEYEIDIMTIDLNMPEMNGLEFLKNLSEDMPDKLESVMKFIITAEGMDEDSKDVTKKYGIRSWIIKPMDVEKFLSMLDTI